MRADLVSHFEIASIEYFARKIGKSGGMNCSCTWRGRDLAYGNDSYFLPRSSSRQTGS